MTRKWLARNSLLRATVPRKRAILAGAVLTLALAGGVAYAAIPGGGGVYTACMFKATGTVRLIDPSLPAKNFMSHCSSAERLIQWNQQGAKGDPGQQGQKGDPGQSGAAVVTTGLGTASVVPGASSDLLVIPNLVTVTLNDCYSNGNGGYVSTVEFTNTGTDALSESGYVIPPGGTGVPPSVSTVVDYLPYIGGPSEVTFWLVDWATRSTLEIHVAGMTHTGSELDNTLVCHARSFAVVKP